MIKNYNNIIIIILTFIIIFIDSSNEIIFNNITFNNYELSLNHIVIVVLVTMITYLFDRNYLYLSFNLQRMSYESSINILVHYTYVFSMCVLLVFNHTMNINFSIILILSEFGILILNLFSNIISNPFRVDKKFILIKSNLFYLMLVSIFLNNQPFEFYAIPMSSFITTVYLTVNIFLVYKFFEILKQNLKSN